MQDYTLLVKQIESLISKKDWLISNLANAAAAIYSEMPDLNWAGFYIMRDGELQLGPFAGKPACVHISVGKGVCGTAAAEGKTQVVPDVHAFPGHIACDSASNSEIVVPIFVEDRVVAVLDIDSPLFDRFGNAEQGAAEQIAREIAALWEEI